MSVMTLMDRRSAVVAAVETFVFFLVITPLYVVAGPFVYAAIAKMFGYVELDWGKFGVSAVFDIVPAWVFAVEGVLYVLLVAVYWVPRDDETDQTELSGLATFVLLLPVVVYVWVELLGWPAAGAVQALRGARALAAIRIAALAAGLSVLGSALLWGAVLAVSALAEGGFGRCFRAWAGSLFFGLAAGVEAGIILMWVVESIAGHPLQTTTYYYLFGGAVAALCQWGAIRETLSITYVRAILVWILPAAATAGICWACWDVLEAAKTIIS